MKNKRTKADYLHSVPEEFLDSEWPKEWPGVDNNMQAGYVQWVGSKPYGTGMSWTFRLKNVEKWFNCGGQSPNVAVGDHIEFDYTEKGGRATVNVGSIKKLEGGQVHNSTPSASFPAPVKSDYAQKESYWSDKAKGDVSKDLRIQWQSARNAAIEITGILVTNGILKLPEKNGSEAVLGKVADLTERFYRESANPPAVESTDVPDSAEAA